MAIGGQVTEQLQCIAISVNKDVPGSLSREACLRIDGSGLQVG